MAHHDSVLGCLRNAGFSVGMTAHAVSLLDSYIYGFALQEVNLPFDSQEELESVGRSIAEQMSGNYRYLAEQIAEHALKPGYSITREFEFGLDFILDGLEKLRDRRN